MTLLSAPLAALFKGRHFDHDIITVCVRWYVTYKLSDRDLASTMAERGIEVAQTTMMRWVQRSIPECEKRWGRDARPVGMSWCIDEPYLKRKGKGVYPYRGVDKEGQTIDFFMSEHRDSAAAKRFLQQAIEKRGAPQKLTVDGYAASHEAVAELQEGGALSPALIVRANRYLNNVIEQNHRGINQRLRPMGGFKSVESAKRFCQVHDEVRNFLRPCIPE
jgi:transposase-like protein